MTITHLSLKWSVSKGRDTYGYNICTLTDGNTGKKYKTCGGGYDMVGTVFADWLEDAYQAELQLFVNEFKDALVYSHGRYLKHPKYYGMSYNANENTIHLDGGCGLESILRIAEAIGLDVQREYIKTGKKRAQTIGWFI